MSKSVVVVLLLLLNVVCEAQSDSLAFSRNARTFESHHSTLVMKGMGSACLSLPSMPDGLPCNPAMTPLSKKPSLGAELQLSNGYSSIDNVRKLLDGKVNQDLVDTLFSKGQIIQIEALADINFRSQYLNGRYTLMSVKGFSVVRNEANPDVEISAIEEQEFVLQTGHEIARGFFAGAQMRALGRKFIKQRFKLVSLGTQAGQDKMKPKEQSALLFEPGASYFFNAAWKPRVSLLVVNLGSFSEKYEELPQPVEAQVGFGISPPMTWGDLDLSLEYRSLNYEESDFKKIRLGALYHFGSMYLTSGIDSNGGSAGVFYGLDKINAGIVYSTTQITSNDEESFYTHTGYVQLGWQI